jgi:hypothetical protein
MICALAATLLVTSIQTPSDTSYALAIGTKINYDLALELPDYQAKATCKLTIEPMELSDQGIFKVKFSNKMEITDATNQKADMDEVMLIGLDNHLKYLEVYGGNLLSVQKIVSMLNTPNGAQEKGPVTYVPYQRTSKLLSEKDGIAQWESNWKFTITNYTIVQKIDVKKKVLIEATCTEKNYAGVTNLATLKLSK